MGETQTKLPWFSHCEAKCHPLGIDHLLLDTPWKLWRNEHFRKTLVCWSPRNWDPEGHSYTHNLIKLQNESAFKRKYYTKHSNMALIWSLIPKLYLQNIVKKSFFIRIFIVFKGYPMASVQVYLWYTKYLAPITVDK